MAFLAPSRSVRNPDNKSTKLAEIRETPISMIGRSALEMNFTHQEKGEHGVKPQTGPDRHHKENDHGPELGTGHHRPHRMRAWRGAFLGTAPAENHEQDPDQKGTGADKAQGASPRKKSQQPFGKQRGGYKGHIGGKFMDGHDPSPEFLGKKLRQGGNSRGQIKAGEDPDEEKPRVNRPDRWGQR